MIKHDEATLASLGMTTEEVEAIAKACETGDLSMWDSSKVSYESPSEMLIAERLAADEIRVCVSEALADAPWLPDDPHDDRRP